MENWIGYCFVEYEVPEGANQAIKKRNGAQIGMI